MKKNFYPNYQLCDTSYIADYADYEEYCKDNDKEPKGENSQDYWEYVNDGQQMEWDDMLENLKYSDANKDMCVIVGSVGTWMGSREITPMVMTSLSKAIEKCATNVDYVKVKVKDGHVEVTATHHDGSNGFEIYKLSAKGIAFANRHMGEMFKGGYPLDVEEIKDYCLAKWVDYLY